MNLEQFVMENEKTITSLTKQTVSTLKELSESTDGIVVDFADMDHLNQMKVLVKEGFVDKEYRAYSSNDNTEQLVEAYEFYQSDEKKFKKMLESVGKDVIKITYKRHDEAENIICEQVATFEKESDGLPVVVVNESAYEGLINRKKGQHWTKYIGEDGRNLVRQKKLKRFYVEDESTQRRYLYIMPPSK